MADVARLVIRVSSDTSAAIRSLESLNARLQSFAASNNNANDSVNRSSTAARTWAERLAESARQSDNATSANNRHSASHRTLQQAFSNSNREARIFGVGISTIAVGVIALSPVFITATGYLGGLTAMLSSSGLALGAFGLAFMALGRQGRAEVLEPLTAATQAWGKSLEGVIAKPINTFAKVLNQNLSQLNPLVNTASEALNRGAIALGNFLKTDEFKDWMSKMNESAKQLLPELGSAFGNVMRGIMNLIVAFLPLAKQMADGFLSWSERFRAWSATLDQNPSFQKFITFVQQNGPRVMQIVGDIAESMFKLILALAPLGLKLLEVADRMAQFINTSDPQKLQNIATAIGAIFLAFKGATMIQGVASSFSSLVTVMGALGPVGTLVAGILLVLGGYLVYVIAHSDHLQSLIKKDIVPAFQDWWGKLQQLNAVLQPIAEAILSVLIPALAAMITVSGQVIGAIATFIGWLGSIPGLISAAGGGIATAWNAVWGGLAQTASGIWDGLKTTWGEVCNAFGPIFTGAAGTLSSIWGGFWNTLSTIAGGIWNTMGVAWGSFVNTLSTIWGTVSTTLSGAWGGFWNTLSTVAGGIWNGMTIAWGTFTSTLGNIWNTFTGTFTSGWSGFWGGLQTVASGIWNGMVTGWGTFTSTLGTVWNSFSSTFTGVWGGFWNGIKETAGSIWNGITATWKSVTDTLGTIWDSAGKSLETAWNGTWNNLKTIASGIWDGIKTAVRDGINGVIGLVNLLIDAWNKVTGAVHLDDLHVDRIDPVSFATGGYVSGPGTATSDSVPARLSNGEYVIKAAAVDHYGRSALDKVNSMAFAKGGYVGNGYAAGGPVSPDDQTFLNTNPDLAVTAPNAPQNTPGGSSGPLDVLGDIAGGVVSAVGGALTGAASIFGDVTKLVLGFIGEAAIHAFFNPMIDAIAGDTPPGQIAAAGFKEIAKSMVDLFIKKDADAKPQIGGVIPEGQHLAIIDAALAAAGVPPPGDKATWEVGLNTLITRESAWNAGAINLTDSNAAAGTPSIGLAQVIQPTFDAYHVPGLDNIYDPVANVAAAIRYIVARYGNITNVQQANANLPPAGYWRGTKWARRGWAQVGEDGPEWVNFGGGEGVKRSGETPWDWTKRDRIDGTSASGATNVGDVNIHIHGPVNDKTLPKLKTEMGDALRMALQCKSGSK